MAVAAARLFKDATAGDYRRVKKFSREILRGCRGALEDIGKYPREPHFDILDDTLPEEGDEEGDDNVHRSQVTQLQSQRQGPHARRPKRGRGPQ